MLLLAAVFGSGFTAGWLLQPLYASRRSEPTQATDDMPIPVVTTLQKSAAFRRRTEGAD